MLTQEAIESSVPLASVLDAHRVYGAAIEGTPLAELTLATRSDSGLVGKLPDGTVSIDTSTMLYLANAQDPTLKVCQHDLRMDEITSVCIQTIQRTMQFTRGVVAPTVTDLVEKTAASLRDLTPSALLGLEVEVYAPPEPLQLPALESIARKFNGAAFDTPAMTMRMPMIPAQEIIELMHTGAGSVDSAIDLWLAGKGESFINRIWCGVFQINPVNPGQSSPSFSGYTEHPSDGVDNALAIFLIARKLVEAGPLPGTEMNKPAFEEAAAAFRDQAASRLVRELEALKLVEKNQVLVRKNVGPKTIVNGSVYRKWVEAGGENEVLFGNMLQRAGVVTVPQIDERKEEFKSKWLSHAALTAKVEGNQRFQRAKQILRQHFNEQLRALNDGEDASDEARFTTLKLFDEELDKLRECDLDDLWGLCLRLVCRSRFYRTDAERILTAIEEVKKANPLVSVREAAAVAIIEYVGWWVSKQMKFQKV